MCNLGPTVPARAGEGRIKLAEERHIAAEPAVVRAAVLNPEVLRQCVPGWSA